MRRCCMILLLAACSVTLAGCWDVKDVGDYNFVTALGLERANQKYVAYIEILDVGSVGKKESGASGGAKPVWVGKAEGRTVMEAIGGIYETSQQRLIWDHIVTLILSDTLLREDLNKLMDGVFRFREIRYTPWVFATSSPIEKVMQNPPFINGTPMITLSHYPESLFKQQSLFIPIRVLNISRYYQEPGASLVIPSLRVDDISWESEQKSKPTLRVDGAYAVKPGSAVWLSESQLQGYRWERPETRRMMVAVKRGDQLIGMVRVDRPHVRIGVSMKEGRPRYSIHISAKGYLKEIMDEPTEAEVKAKVEREIADQVLDTFKAAAAKKVDIYQLEHYLFRKHYADWKRLQANRESGSLEPDTLAKVDVDVTLVHSGIYHMR